MKALIAIALVATSTPVIAFAAADGNGASQAREQRVCTRLPARAGSRSAQRICLTEAQWAARVGPDWRQVISGRLIEDDLEMVGARTKSAGSDAGVFPN